MPDERQLEFELEDETGTVIERPFDPALVRIESRVMTLGQLVSRMQHNEIDLAPDFQRAAGIWKVREKSRLIESLLVRIPIPAFYFDARNEDRWLVIDGLQRLSTLREFVILKTLRLSELEFLEKLNGNDYDQLDRNFQRRIDETQVTVSCIQPGTPPEVTYNLFKRINTGGLPLEPQEIRNALNPGAITGFLLRLSEDVDFKLATRSGFNDQRMTDRECALRFCAFRLTSPEKYAHADFDGFLNEAMQRLNTYGEVRLAEEHDAFRLAMQRATELFGNRAFSRQFEEGRRQLNKAVFEVWSVNLAKLNEAEWRAVLEKKEALLAAWNKLCHDAVFISSVSQATGNAERIRRRFRMTEELITQFLKAP